MPAFKDIKDLLGQKIKIGDIVTYEWGTAEEQALSEDTSNDKGSTLYKFIERENGKCYFLECDDQGNIIDKNKDNLDKIQSVEEGFILQNDHVGYYIKCS